MKSLAVIIAAVSLVASASFAGAVEAGKIEGKVKTEGQVTGATGAKVTTEANVAGSSVRSGSTSTAKGNIISNIANTKGAAAAIGGTCEPGAFDSLSIAERATIAAAVRAGLAGDRCAKQFDAETVKTIAAMDAAELAALKASGATSATDSKLSDKTKGSFVVQGAKVLASRINVSVQEAEARIEGTCAKACDVESSALCVAPVLNAARAEAASL